MTKGFFSTAKIQTKRKTGHLAHCGSCGLYKHCKSPKMPATGDGRKNILVVAEAPGKDEDALNTQLVGKAGKLFRIYLKSFGVNLDRDCVKTNAVICRPRDNKKPEDNMINACRPNLLKTLKKCDPNVIILLGAVACKSLLSELWTDDLGQISRWVGFCIPCRKPNAWIVPTFHPSYINRMGEEQLLSNLFKKHLELAVSKAKSKPWKEVPDYKKCIEIVTRPSQAAKIIREMIQKGGATAFDYETNCLKPDGEGTELVSCSVCWRGRRTISYPWQGEAIEATDELTKSPLPKIAANLKFEDRWTRAKLGHRVRNWFHDTMLAAHVLDNRPDITSLNFQSFVQLGQEPYDTHIKPFLRQKKNSHFNRIHELDLNDLLMYGGLDSYCEYWLAMKQRQLFKERSC
jgi:DNA polymerase